MSIAASPPDSDNSQKTPVAGISDGAAKANGRGQAAASSLPVIQVNDRQLRSIVDDAWAAIHAANVGPQIFRRGSAIVRLEHYQDGPFVRPMDTAVAIYGHLARVANWAKLIGDQLRNRLPLKEVAADILCYPNPALPQLDEVVAVPIFDSQGNLIAEPGYHADERLWLHLPECFAGLRVPENPRPDEIRSAQELLRGDLLIDFPFVQDSDRAHALAALILRFVQRMIAGRTPIHEIEAPTAGSGKGLLADVVALLAKGRTCVVTTLPSDRGGDEMRKKITAILLRADPIILLDNVVAVASNHLAAAITADPWTDRILGKSRMVELPNRATWLLTGNNPTLSREIARRCIRIRIDPGRPDPELRTDFRHKALRGWVLENRARLVGAILTLVRAWIVAGRPLFKSKTLGSFEEWSGVIGGILEVAGIPGFLDSVVDQHNQDPETALWQAFIEWWWRLFAGRVVGVAELFDFAHFDLGGGSDHSRKTRLGRLLTQMRDRRFGKYRIVAAGNYQGAMRWRLEEIP